MFSEPVGADPNAINNHGFTPLGAASVVDAPALVEAVLDAGAAIDFKPADGGTALYLAALYGSAQALEVLVRRGANARIAYGSTANYPSGVICLCVNLNPRPNVCTPTKCEGPADNSATIAALLDQVCSSNTFFPGF